MPQAAALRQRPATLSDFVAFGGAASYRQPARSRVRGEAAFVGGLNDILLVAAIVAFVGAALSAALTRPRDFVPHAAAAAPERRGLTAADGLGTRGTYPVS